MHIIRLIFIVNVIFYLQITATALAMSGDQVVRLKQAGVSDKTLQLMIQEKSIETASLTVDEVLGMKAAGIEEETLQVIVKSRSFMNHNHSVVYEIGPQAIQVTSVEDLVVLKEAGFSEESIRAIVTVVATDENKQTYKDALRLLDNIGIWVTPHYRLPRDHHKPLLPSPGMRPE